MRPTTKDNINYAWIMCIFAAVFYCYEYLLRVLPSVIVPDLMQSLNIGATQIGLISSFYFLTYTPMQIVVGTIMDHFGVRIPLTIATLSCALGIYIFSMPELIYAKIGMLLVGFGSAFAFVGVLKIAADWMPNKYFALIAGVTTTLGMAGAISGETSLSTAINNFGLEDAMLGLSISGIILTIFIFVTIKDKKLLHSHSCINEIKKLAFDLIFVAKNKQIWVVGIIGMLLYTPTTTFAGLWGVPYLQMTRGLNAHDAGVIVSMIFVGWAIGSPLTGILSGWIKTRKKILTVGALLCAITLIKILYFPSESIAITMTLMFLLGFFSSSEILIFAVAHDIIPNNLAGTAVSLTNMLVMVSGVMQYLIGYWLENSQGAAITGSHIHVFTETNFQAAFIIMPVGLVIAFFLSFFLKESYHLKK